MNFLVDIPGNLCYNTVRWWDAGVAQLVEQLICNQQVGGSSPSTSSIFFYTSFIPYGRVPEWPKGADCKSVAFQLRWSESILSHHNAPNFGALILFAPCIFLQGLFYARKKRDFARKWTPIVQKYIDIALNYSNISLGQRLAGDIFSCTDQV